jgi:hypothetical protein
MNTYIKLGVKPTPDPKRDQLVLLLLFKFEKLWIEDIVKSIVGHPFLTNFRVDMTSFVNSHMMLSRRSDFKPLQVHKMKLNQKVGHKVKSYKMSIFTSGRGCVFIKISLN